MDVGYVSLVDVGYVSLVLMSSSDVAFVTTVEVWVTTADARYTIMMMLSVRLNLRYLLLMVNMTLMLTSLGRLLLIKSLHVMNFLRLHVLGLLLVSVFSPRGVTPTSKFVCVLPFPDGDARRDKDLSWFGQEKALRPAGEESLYYLAPKCLYRGEYKCGMKCGVLQHMSVGVVSWSLSFSGSSLL